MFGELMALGGIGGALYMGLELAFRGRTHWTMGLAGGLCFWLVGGLNELAPGLPVSAQAMLGGGLITAVELVFGLIFNRRYTVWDYRNIAHNYRGQICLPFFALWVLLASVVVYAEDAIRAAMFR